MLAASDLPFIRLLPSTLRVVPTRTYTARRRRQIKRGDDGGCVSLFFSRSSLLFTLENFSWCISMSSNSALGSGVCRRPLNRLRAAIEKFPPPPPPALWRKGFKMQKLRERERSFHSGSPDAPEALKGRMEMHEFLMSPFWRQKPISDVALRGRGSKTHEIFCSAESRVPVLRTHQR